MSKSFEDAISDLVTRYLSDGVDPDEIISGMELQIMTIREQHMADRLPDKE